MPGPFPWPEPMVPAWAYRVAVARAEKAEAEVAVLTIGIKLASGYLDEGDELAAAIRATARDNALSEAEVVWLRAGAPTRIVP